MVWQAQRLRQQRSAGAKLCLAAERATTQSGQDVMFPHPHHAIVCVCVSVSDLLRQRLLQVQAPRRTLTRSCLSDGELAARDVVSNKTVEDPHRRDAASFAPDQYGHFTCLSLRVFSSFVSRSPVSADRQREDACMASLVGKSIRVPAVEERA